MNPQLSMRQAQLDGSAAAAAAVAGQPPPPPHGYYSAASPLSHAQHQPVHHHAQYPPPQQRSTPPPHSTSPQVSSLGSGLAAHSNLYIAGIPHSWSLAQLDEYFGAFGPISESRILMDKSTQASRGIAFVRFAHMESAKLAIQHCHGTTPPGGVEKLVVKPATDKNTLQSMQPSGYPSPVAQQQQQHVQPASALPTSYSPLMQLPMHTSPQQLLVQQQAQQQQQQHASGSASPHLPFPVSTVSAAHFLQQQQLPASALSQHPAHSPLSSSLHTSPATHSQHSAPPSQHVVYSPSTTPLQLRGGNDGPSTPVLHSASHLPYLSSTPLASRPAQVYTAWHPNRRGTPQPGVQLFVFHLPPEITNEQLVPLFAHFGHVLNCAIMRDPQTLQSKGFGFVTFKEERDAEQAIRYLNGFNLGNKFLKVEYKVTKGGPRREGEPGRNIYANTNPNGRHHQAYQASLRQQQQQQERLMRELAKQQQQNAGMPMAAAEDPLSPLSPHGHGHLSQGSSPAQPSSAASAPFDAHNMSAMLAQLQQLTVQGGAADHKMPLHTSSAPNTPFVQQSSSQPNMSSNNASLVLGNYAAQQQQQSHPSSSYLHPGILTSPSHHAQSSSMSSSSQMSFSSPLLSSMSPSSVASGVGGYNSALGSASQTPVSSQPSSASLSALAPRLNSPGPLAPLPPAALIADHTQFAQPQQYSQQADSRTQHSPHHRSY